MNFFPINGPPAAVEAEQAIVGAILADNRRYELVADSLRPEHFFDPGTARVFADAVRRIRDGQVGDIVTLRAAYEASGELDAVGGAQYLAGLLSAMAPPSALPSYAALIIDCWRRRQIIGSAEDAIARARAIDSDDDGAAIASATAGELLEVAESGASASAISIGDAAREVLRAAQAAHERGGRALGLPTGVAALDTLLGGLAPAQMVVLGARPGVGKTAVALSIALAAARAGIGVAIFSLEMASDELAERLLANIAGIPGTAIRDGRMDQRQWDLLVAAEGELDRLDIQVDDTPGLTMQRVLLRVRAMSRKRPVGLVIVDHLGLLAPPAGTEKSGPVVATEANSKSLKALAKELRLPVLALSQLNRALEGRDEKRPGLADLRWSGSIEQDADVVMFIHREEMHLRNRAPTRKPDEGVGKFEERVAAYDAALAAAAGRAELIVAKQRRGPTGIVAIRFDAATCRINDAEWGASQ